MLFIIIIISLISYNTFAQDKFYANLAYFFQTKSMYRGAEIWPRPTTMAGPSFTFYGKLSINGPNIEYRFFPHKSPWHFNLGANMFSDDEPLLSLQHHNKDHRNQRKTTYEVNASVTRKFGFRNLFSVGGFFSQDLKAYKGQFLTLKLSAPLIPFLKIRYAISYGEKSTNKYLYGPESRSGLGYHALELSYVIVPPKLPWEGIIINTLKSSWVIYKKNRNADYVRGRSAHTFFSLFLLWTFY